jgi:hypothetical protein
MIVKLISILRVMIGFVSVVLGFSYIARVSPFSFSITQTK